MSGLETVTSSVEDVLIDSLQVNLASLPDVRPNFRLLLGNHGVEAHQGVERALADPGDDLVS